MKYFKKSSSMLLALIMIFSVASFNASAKTNNKTTSTTKSQSDTNNKSKTNTKNETTSKEKFNEIISSFNNPNGRLMSVAHKGNWRNFPENSLEGIQSCIDMGVDIVEVDIQKTKDGNFVLMSDKKLSRMCVDKDGRPATSNVSEETLDEIKEYYFLRDSRGGVNSKATEYKVPSLEEAIKLCKNHNMLMIDNAWKYGDEVQSIVKKLDADSFVILRGATTPEDIATYIEKNELPISHICGYYNGVMSSPAKNYVKDTISAGAKIIELASKNSYSSLYKKSVLKKFDNNGRAFVSAISPERCGDREDMKKDWDDLVKRGYSVIETNYPQELVNYIKEIENDKAILSSLITQAQGINNSNYSKDTAKELKKALKDAEEISSDGSASLDDIDLFRYNLQKSIDNMTPRSADEKSGLSTGTIVALVIIAIILVICILFVLKRSKKKTPISPTAPTPPMGPNESNPNSFSQRPPQKPVKRKKITFGKKKLRKKTPPKKPPVRENHNPNSPNNPNNKNI